MAKKEISTNVSASNPEAAIISFKRAVTYSRKLLNLKLKRYYESPSEKRARKKKESRKRIIKDARNSQG